jgi:chemotaxis protein MotC
MMRRIRVLPGMAMAAGLLLAAPVIGEEAGSQPFELVRTLRAVQDRIAHGDSAAHEGQRELLAEIGAKLVRADAAAWKDPRNARAAVLYVLSGGDPSVLSRLSASGSLPGIDETLVKGVLGYSEGRSADAETLLSIDPRRLDPTIAGHVALVQSGLVMPKDASKALSFLDEARLRAPGTLVEEAGLRRQAFLLLAAGNRDGFEATSSRYFRRFGDSVYAPSFRMQFAMEVVGEKYAVDGVRLKRLEAILADVSPADRRELYLSIAAQGIVRGKVEAAGVAGGHASRLADDGTAARARAELYRGAALVVTDEYESGLAALTGVDRGRLDSADTELLEAALQLAGQLRKWPEPVDKARTLQEIEAKATHTERPVVLATAKVLGAVQKLNMRVDQMLDGVAK